MKKQQKKATTHRLDPARQDTVQKFADQLQEILGHLPRCAQRIQELLDRWGETGDTAPGLLGGNLLVVVNEAVVDEQAGRLSENASHRHGAPEDLADHAAFVGGLLGEYATLLKMLASIELEQDSPLFNDWNKVADELLQYSADIQRLAEELEVELEGEEEPEAAAPSAGRRVVQEIWKKSQAGEPLAGEQERLAQVLKEHPEYQVAWESGGQAGQGTIGGVNPFVHATLHVIVENQLAEGDPPETAATLARLTAAGLSRHEAMHRIGNAAIEQIYRMRREKRPFHRAAYVRALSELK